MASAALTEQLRSIPKLSLTGKTALVTSGAADFGKQLTLARAEAGAGLVVTGRRQQVLEEVAVAVDTATTVVPGAVKDENTLRRLAERRQRRHPREQRRAIDPQEGLVETDSRPPYTSKAIAPLSW
jgi:NAD(P)-dependent dehydrogenase (short-subunit alcohol dehydrogenase family)